MTTDTQRSATTAKLFDAEIDAIIARAPTGCITPQALAVAIRLTLDRHQLYDRRFTAALQTAAALPEPARSEACARLAHLAGPPKTWLAYLALQWLRLRKIEVSYLYPADRGVISDRLRATSTVAATFPLMAAAE